MDNINTPVGSTEVHLVTEFFPGSIIPQWVDMTANVFLWITVIFIIAIAIPYLLYRWRYNAHKGVTTKEISEKIASDDIDDITDKDLRVNYLYRRIIMVVFAVLVILYSILSIGSIIVNSDKQKIYRGIESTTSASLDGAKIQGKMSESNVFQLNDGTLMKYKLDHKQGSVYTLKVFTEGRPQ